MTLEANKLEAVLSVDSEEFQAEIEEATEAVKDLNAELEELAELMEELGVDSLEQVEMATSRSEYSDIRDATRGVTR